jgi:hypothetical protein
MAAFMGIEQGNAAAQRGTNALPPSKAPTDNNGEKAARCFVVSRSDGAGRVGQRVGQKLEAQIGRGAGRPQQSASVRAAPAEGMKS